MKKPLSIFKLVIAVVLVVFFLLLFLSMLLPSFLNTPLDQLILALVYGLGLGCQIVLTLEKDVFSKKMLIATLLAPIGFLPGKNETVYIFSVHIFMCLVVWAITVAVIFRDQVLPRINERSVLQIFLIAFYLVMESCRNNVIPSVPVLCISLLLIIVAPVLFYLIFSKHTAGSHLRAYMYVWFLTISLLMLIMQTGSFGLEIFFGDPGTLKMTSQMLAVALFNGMVLFPVLTNGFYLLELLPFTGRGQSFAKRIKDIRYELKEMIVHYAPDPFSKLECLLVILIQGGFLAANYFLGFMSPSLAILISFACVEVVVHLKLDYWYELRSFVSGGQSVTKPDNITGL